MRHPPTYPENLKTVLQHKKDAPGVNSFHLDLDLDLARCLDLVGLIKTPEAEAIDS